MQHGAETLSVTGFALSCLGVSAPQPSRRQRWPQTVPCRVCGVMTDDGCAGVLSESFAEAADFAVPGSPAVCPSCMYFARGDTWQAYAAARPQLGIKYWPQASWRSYSHFFSPDGVEHPGPRRWAALLDSPPAPPWMAVVSVQARRNLIWRGCVATDARFVPVLLETELIWLDDDWPAVRMAFETLRRLGFARDSILAGQMSHAAALKAGVAPTLDAWRALLRWRQFRPDLLRLAHAVSVRPDEVTG